MGFNDLNKPKKTYGADNVQISGPTSNFGEVSVVSNNPVAQGDFVYNINSQTFITGAFDGASVVQESGSAILQSGANPYGAANVELRRRLEYKPGQGSLIRATCLYGAPSSGNRQLIGAGSSECGYFIGYNSTDFGILHTETGQREIRRLDITTGAGTGNVTVTLDGDSVIVPVVGGSNKSRTAYQLANADYSQVGDGGWLADTVSGSVFFISTRSETTFTGSYSVSGSSIVGNFTRLVPGEEQVNTFIPSGSFNKDKLDGTGPSGMILDPSKGNVYEIGIQYLGYGNATFSVEDPETGFFHLFHIIKNANSRTTPVLKNPNLSIVASSRNIGGTTGSTLKTVSMAGYTQGKIEKYDPKFAKSFNFSGINKASYVPLALLKANRVFNNQSSFGEFDLLRIGASNEVNNKTLTIGFFLNPIVNGNVDFKYIDQGNSIVSYAELAPATNTFANSPVPFFESVVGSTATILEQIEKFKYIFGPGDVLAIGIKTTASITGQVSVNWFEQQ
jgi:hypothetical protein